MRWSIVALAPLAVSVAALSVDEPKKGAEIDSSKSFVVKWSSVESDPSSFDIYLVNNAIYPSVEKKIATGIDTSKGSYTVDDLDISAGHGYQINLLSDAKLNTGILAQSQQFNVTGDSHSSSSTSITSSSSSTTTGASTKDTTLSGTLVKTTSDGTAITTATSAGSSTTSSGSASGSVTGTSSATPTTVPNGGASLVAHPMAIAGVFAGALAFAL
ncbi:hypothetical protein N7509_004441 [Penicillium cosmopolitanum]|uniref:Yeast cell wall synthesis Kre9/Knh1-like N-terminal domain-containing protein n=1 Tax=Penicillium cosmopolitanum TaxID=1131564 RepID=A0A9W9W6Z5_9EURO|nr:uncharacterized protein N7509_004441 [Penicillium cosmopolitanum]KAJ5404570.1 hypothetical protein N7509_004441 [Penicillium cosmopolitanum]